MFHFNFGPPWLPEDFENVNAANLAGLLWYLELVFPQCPRHYNITRILRCLVEKSRGVSCNLG